MLRSPFQGQGEGSFDLRELVTGIIPILAESCPCQFPVTLSDFQHGDAKIALLPRKLIKLLVIGSG